MNTNKERAHLPGAAKMEALMRFSGGIAHDFNNILGAIEGYATLAGNSLKDGDPGKEDMEEIRRSVARAAVLTKRLLVFAGRRALAKGPCDIAALLAGLPPQAENGGGKEFKVKVEVQPGLPPVNADPVGIEKALLNLLANAREAAPGGTVTVRAGVYRPATGGGVKAPGEACGGYVKISVADSGQGIPEDVQEHLFEPFFTTKTGIKGSGFGLAEAYGIVKYHKGRVEFESEPGRGSEFSIFLPLTPSAET